MRFLLVISLSSILFSQSPSILGIASNQLSNPDFVKKVHPLASFQNINNIDTSIEYKENTKINPITIVKPIIKPRVGTGGEILIKGKTTLSFIVGKGLFTMGIEYKLKDEKSSQNSSKP